MGSIDPRTVLDKTARLKDMNLSVQVGQKRCSGFVECNVGESTLAVPFPVMYVEKPLITYGVEFPTGQVFNPGRWPVINCIFQLTKGTFGATGHKWTGMNLYIVFSGQSSDPNYKAIVHWNAIGQAFTNPTKGG